MRLGTYKTRKQKPNKKGLENIEKVLQLWIGVKKNEPKLEYGR